jgi:heme oxygenase
MGPSNKGPLVNTNSSARAIIRSATAQHHDAVDRIFSVATLSEPAGFSRFLLAQAGAFIPAEEALERDGAATMVPDWAERRRATRLRADLTALGLECPLPAGQIRFASGPALLGGLYVLEGSRLGGAMLRRAVPEGWPASFLQPGPSALWRDFLSMLEQLLVRDEDIAAASDAACHVFRLFELSGRRHIGAAS